MTETRRRHVLWVAMVAAVVITAMLSALAVIAATAAADLDGSDHRPGPTTEGHHTVELAVPPLVPGDEAVQCVEVAGHDGPGLVRLHGRSSGELVDHLALEVERGATGATCDRPGPLALVFDGALGRLGDDYRSGHDADLAAGSDRPTPYFLTIHLTETAPNSAQGAGASLAVTWEVRPIVPSG